MDVHFDRFDSLDETPAYIIHRVARRLRVQLWRFLQEYDPELTPEKWFILLRCHEQPGISQRELGDKVLNDQPNVKRLVDGLVQQGLLERHRDGADHRRYRVFLTEAGGVLLTRLLPAAAQLRESLFGDIAPERLRAAFETLADIERKLPVVAG